MYDDNESGYSFIQSVYHDIGTLNDQLKIRVIESIDLIKNYSDFAVRFELIHVNDKNEIDGRYYINVIAEEAEQLIFSMETIINTIIVEPPKNYTEVVFRSSEGFQAGCFWYKEEKTWYEFVNLGNEENSQLILNAKDFKKILTLLKKAKKFFIR